MNETKFLLEKESIKRDIKTVKEIVAEIFYDIDIDNILNNNLEYIYDENKISTIVRILTIIPLLINIVEDVYQTKLIKKQYISKTYQDGMIDKLIDKYSLDKFDKEKLKKIFFDIRVIPVLTAHPTQIQRKSILDLTTNIYNIIEKRYLVDNYMLSEVEWKNELKREINLLCQTDILRNFKLRVDNEITNSLGYYNSTFLKAIPKINIKFKNISKKLDIFSHLYNPIIMGTWIGGDRDGNPFVTHKTLLNASFLQTQMILKYYISELELLYKDFSISILKSNITEELKQLSNLSLDDSEHRLFEPYRRTISYIITKLKEVYKKIIENAEDLKYESYYNDKELLKDLLIIRKSIELNNDEILAYGRLDELIEAVKVFGYHLSSIDLRQDSSVYEYCINELLKNANIVENYFSLKEEEKIKILLYQLEKEPRKLTSVNCKISETLEKELAIFNTVKILVNRYGKNIIGQNIISHTVEVSDILELKLLLKQFDLEKIINISPLFETIIDLQNSKNIMKDYFELDIAKKWLRYNDNMQEIMLGYSDSNKDGGYISSSYRLYIAQKELVKLSEEYNININFFHGRGGTVGRGGGPSYQAILSQPSGSIMGKIRLTEQGEVIGAKYGNLDLGLYNLEALVCATLEKSFKKDMENIDEYEKIMEDISNYSYLSYKKLVYETNGFDKYFFESTPINEVSKLNIGSRPTSRNKVMQIDNLRAIPWVFSWSQTRVMLQGWYGVGSSFNEYISKNGVEKLKEMYKKWPFFKSLLSNVEMVLSKTDMKIAKKYSYLVKNEEISQKIYSMIYEEWKLTLKIIKQIMEIDDLLVDNEMLRFSLENRLPYFNTLNNIQVELIKQQRLGNDSDNINKAIHTTINGIATGLRNSG